MLTLSRSERLEALREELERQERSARWLARKVGVDPSLVHRILTGERNPSADFREKAAIALGVSEAALFPQQAASAA